MRKLLTLLTLMLTAFSLSAKDVTPEEALQKATQFIAKKHQAGGARLAPGAVPQLTLAAQPSGLYVFNVKDSQGFVIVSPDDCTEAILGYSESGTFNEETMPENMRAWLQGYARQIAWAQQNNIQASNAPRQADRAAVAPLVKAHWDQGAPYYNSCPKKGSRYTYTGCVATAMAQVMHYFQWPNATQEDIPGYTTADGLTVKSVAAGATIDWSNILVGYGYYCDNGEWKNQSSNSAQKKAVADLMFYCGASTKMEYTTQGSGTISGFIAPAFVRYFGYDPSARLVDRTCYTTSQWEEIIYHEIANSRPVIYSGTTSTNMNDAEGHEFICDGYQKDGYFHINWGWASSDDVDGFFKLSALNPDSQGAGGSSTGNGFNYYQDAVIGIQPPGTGGTVSDAVYEGSVVLEATNITLSQNPATPGSKVTLTATITNLGSSWYRNGIWVIDWVTEEEKYVSGNFSSGQQRTISVTFDVPEQDYMQFIIAGVQNDGIPLYLGVSEQLTIGEEAAPEPTTVDVKIGENGWGTLSSTYGLDFRALNVTAYVVTGETDGIITKRKVSKVPAETGLLVSGTANQTYTVPTMSSSFDDVSDNKLVAQMETKKVGRVGGGTVRFFFGEQDGQVGFAYPSSSSVEVNAGEAYLALTGTSSDYAEKTWLPLEESATGIERTTIEGTVTDGYYYTLDGRRVTNPTKGIYIYQGRKVLVK